jgi:hypothetical protein
MSLHNEDVIAGCQAGGATSNQYNTALLQWAEARGATAGDMPTAMVQALNGLGYTGALSEMFIKWAADGYPSV